MTERTAAFYHPHRKQIYTGVILEKVNLAVNCVDGVKGTAMFKMAYFDGKDNLVAHISPKNVIPFD